MGRNQKPDQVRLPGLYFDLQTVGIIDTFKRQKNLGRNTYSGIIEQAVKEYCSESIELIGKRLGLKFEKIDISQFVFENFNESQLSEMNNGDWIWTKETEIFVVEVIGFVDNETFYPQSGSVTSYIEGCEFDFNLNVLT